MKPDLPDRLLAIAETVSEWDAPITAAEDLREAADEIERLRSELSDATAWRQRHSDDAEARGRQTVEQFDEIKRLREELRIARSGLFAVGGLIADSRGVDGLHLNGDVAEWTDIRTGWPFEEWLSQFDVALEAATAAGGEE